MARSKLPHVLRFLRDIKTDIPPLEGGRSRRAALASTSVGAIYLARFDSQLTKLETLPASLKDGKQPFTSELDAADATHDGLGRQLFYYCESVLHSPRSTIDQRGAADRIRQAFVPTLAILMIDYEKEGDLHDATKFALEERHGDLDLFPVAASATETSPVTLRAVATQFVASKAEINRWISARAAKLAENASEADRRRAAHLLSETIGLINRCRSSLRDAIDDVSLAANIAAEVFGILDQSSAHEDELAASRSEAPQDTPQSATGPATSNPPTVLSH